MKIAVRTAALADLHRLERLKQDAYDVRGYCSKPGAIEQCLRSDHALVLIAETAQGEAVGTVSVLFDTGEIPTDEVFPAETAHIRAASTQIAYVGSFAVKPDLWRRKGFSIGLTLIRELLAKAAEVGAPTVVIIVNPRHMDFYERLGFREAARCGNMPGLEKAPAVMLTLASEGTRNLIKRAATSSLIC